MCRTETAEPNEDAEDMYFALKEIDLTMVRAEFLDELENEIKLLKALVSAQNCTPRTPAAVISHNHIVHHAEFIHISEGHVTHHFLLLPFSL